MQEHTGHVRIVLSTDLVLIVRQQMITDVAARGNTCFRLFLEHACISMVSMISMACMGMQGHANYLPIDVCIIIAILNFSKNQNNRLRMVDTHNPHLDYICILPRLLHQ